ncbi:hypothetical protein [Sphaerisporangium aureirubrum]|uniref:Uncharacterized protein n=1 Tax=Sphaerisporangium aureirubrum TaxID=1544736 RepID=A0ABW1NJX5_9ACTN
MKTGLTSSRSALGSAGGRIKESGDGAGIGPMAVEPTFPTRWIWNPVAPVSASLILRFQFMLIQHTRLTWEITEYYLPASAR